MNQSITKTAPIAHFTSDKADLFTQASALDFGDIHFKFDRSTGLRAIIAIHNTRFGPALGGCRFITYPSTEAALFDVMNLAHTMSYKAAIASLPLGGGKAVIMRPEHIENREALFEAYGDFVDELGGRYITSVDSGTGVADMDAAARRTQYVRSTSDKGDPSPYTAMGVLRGIEAAVKFKLGRNQLDGVRVSIQGAGHVGYPLVKELHALGACLIMCDIDKNNAERCADEFGSSIVSADDIFSVNAEVFAPCALGGVINDETIHKLNVDIVAGATNNPLADISHAISLHQKGILYAPDYVINAGGLMQVWIEDKTSLHHKVLGIYDVLLSIFEQSAKTHQSPALIADRMAKDILYGGQGS